MPAGSMGSLLMTGGRHPVVVSLASWFIIDRGSSSQSVYLVDEHGNGNIQDPWGTGVSTDS